MTTDLFKSSLLLITSTLLAASLAFCQTPESSNFELVESIPIETTLDNPDIRNTHEVWMEMISKANRSLDLEEFYVSNQKGEPLDDIIAAIQQAAGRGVKVRLIADSRMYRTYPETVDTLGKEKNITARIIDYRKLAGGIQHAKYFIVDGEQVFLGSQNFDWRALKHIHELGVRIRQPQAVQIYQEIFDTDWDLAGTGDSTGFAAKVRRSESHGFLKASRTAGDTVRFMPTASPIGLIPDSSMWDERQIVGLIGSATSDVMCQFLTYSTSTYGHGTYATLDSALRSAASRGVKVRMIVSDWSIGKPIGDELKSLAGVPNIEVKYSAIPDWSGGYISFARVEHCKYLVIDSSRSWIGTANWEKSYFYNTRNVGVVVEDEPISSRLRRIFLMDWDGPYTHSILPSGEYTGRIHGEKN